MSPEENQEPQEEKNKRPWAKYESDIDAYIWLCGAYSHARYPTTFCKSYDLDASRFAEVAALAAQLAQLLRPLLMRAEAAAKSQAEGQPEMAEAAAGCGGGNGGGLDLSALKPPLKLDPPAHTIRRGLHECVVQGFIDRVAVWQDPPRLPADATQEERAAARGGYRCAELKGQLALLHPSSTLLQVKCVFL